MIVMAIVACEVGFWVVLVAGLITRYGLHRPRSGAALLVCVPLVDLALLLFTVIDLRRGTPAEFAHGLAAVYLGFSVAFGHSMVRWADIQVAYRCGGGPAPRPKPASGTPARLRQEWRTFGRACVAVGLSALLLLGAITLVGDSGDPAALAGWLNILGLVLAGWLIGWPLWETGRQSGGRAARAANSGNNSVQDGKGAGDPPARALGTRRSWSARSVRRTGLLR